MKKYTILYVFLSVFIITSCEVEEDNLQPSNLDEDRVVSQIDINNPTVQRLYADFNMGVLHEYDSIMDFSYVASSRGESDRWAQVEIPELKTLFENEQGEFSTESTEVYNVYVEEAITFIDENLFQYFKPDTRIADLMPHKILLSASIYSEIRIPGEASEVIVESDARQTSSPRASMNAIYNSHSIVFDLNLDNYNTTSKIEDFSKDNFYILLSRIMGVHDLYSEIPESFFDGKDQYYDQDLEPIFRQELEIGEDKYVWVIDKDWIYSKGFIDAQYFYNQPSGLRTVYVNYDEDYNRLDERIVIEKGFRPRYSFIEDREEDVRSYINELIFRNTEEFEAYPQNIQDNLQMMYNLITGWGVDLLAVNPDLEYFN